MKHHFFKLRESIILNFWKHVPKSCLYWAVNQAWALATTQEHTDKSPNEVTWEMVQKFLSKR